MAGPQQLMPAERQRKIQNELYTTEITHLKSLVDQKSVLTQLLTQSLDLSEAHKQKINQLINLTDSLIKRSENVLQNLKVKVENVEHATVNRDNVEAILQNGINKVEIVSFDYLASLAAMTEKSAALQEYAGRYDAMLDFFPNQLSPQAKSFLEDILTKPPVNALNFDALLIAPIQRDPRYMLLTTDILKNESDNNLMATMASHGNTIKSNLDEINENRQIFPYQYQLASYQKAKQANEQSNTSETKHELRLASKDLHVDRVNFDKSMRQTFKKIANENDPIKQTKELNRTVLLEIKYLQLKWNYAKDNMNQHDPNHVKVSKLCDQLKEIENKLYAAAGHASKEINEVLSSQMALLNATLKEMPANIRANFKDFNEQFKQCHQSNSKQLAVLDKSIKPIVSACKKEVHEALKGNPPITASNMCLQAEIKMYQSLIDTEAYNVIKSKSTPTPTAEEVKTAWENNIKLLQETSNNLMPLLRGGFDDKARLEAISPILQDCKNKMKNEIQHTHGNDNQLKSTLDALMTHINSNQQATQTLENARRENRASTQAAELPTPPSRRKK